MRQYGGSFGMGGEHVQCRISRLRSGGPFLCIAFLLLLGGSMVRGATPALPLHTSGRFIVDSNGHRVKLAAVNWYGAEERDYVVAGLEYAPLADIAHRVRSMGFNAVRLPWSNEMYELNPILAAPRLAANPALQGMRALDVFDAVVEALAAEGLYVILDNHTSTADWCCSNSDGNGFWYNSKYPESSWIADWQAIAQRYAGQPAVIGADLRNEPRGPVWGGSDPRYDWRAAAERAGNAVLDANPRLLIIVEGINYAADLTGARTAPVRLNVDQKLVYSSHDYSWFHNGLTSYASLKSQLDAKWGFLLDGDTAAPVWVGEFGVCHTSPSCVSSTNPSDSGFWFSAFLRYIQEHDVDWAYWALNGTQASGTGRTLGAEETFGILKRNWAAVASAGLLNSLQAVSAPTVRPVIKIGGIVNSSDFRAGVPVAPGSLASILGTHLAPISAAADSVPLPLALGGGRLEMSSGLAVPILFASPDQMNVQIPWEADPAAPVTMKAIVGSLSSGEEPVPVAAASPVIFFALSGSSQALAFIFGGSVLAAQPSDALPNARPAHPGESISIYCTGLGAVHDPPATGFPASSDLPATSTEMPAVKIGSEDCAARFSGLEPGYVGLYRVDVQLPPNVPIGDSIPVSVSVAGIESNVATIAIAQ